MNNKRNFTVEYKREIIKLVTAQGKKVSHVAKDIDVSEATVRRWIKEYGEHGSDAFPGKGNLRPDDEEIRLIRKKIADLEEENSILGSFAYPAKKVY